MAVESGHEVGLFLRKKKSVTDFFSNIDCACQVIYFIKDVPVDYSDSMGMATCKIRMAGLQGRVDFGQAKIIPISNRAFFY